ncbi:multimerin-1 isoform X2 [Cimex lectularius]|uniref:Uncharacterized protein n=1 Tax=Cimex lectularius TaxID=79782 RepID=A0A8I6SC03_CIMLE|nr:multimerin-1 isoform X2 [Cimex lectularius]
MKNKVGQLKEECNNRNKNRLSHLHTCQKQKRGQKDQHYRSEGRTNIYDELNKAFHVLRTKRPVHPEEVELGEQKKRVLRVFRNYLKEDKMEDNRVYAYTDSEGVSDEGYTDEEEYKAEFKSRNQGQKILEQQVSTHPTGAAIPVATTSALPSVEASKDINKSQSKSPKAPMGCFENEQKKFENIHLSDSTVLEELRIADQRANNAAKMLETVREQIARYAEKEEMTEEDIQIMQRKQAELMEKMSEFEEITKRVQQLVGLRDVSSTHLGLPNKPITIRKSDKCVEELPKVVICGPGGIEQVPKIIVCSDKKTNKQITTQGHAMPDNLHPSMDSQNECMPYYTQQITGEPAIQSQPQILEHQIQTFSISQGAYTIPQGMSQVPMMAGYPEPFVPYASQQYPWGQVVNSAGKPPRELVPKVNDCKSNNSDQQTNVTSEEGTDNKKLSVLDTEVQWAQLKWQEKSLMALLKNIIQQKDLHMNLVGEQYLCSNWEKMQDKLKELYAQHQKMLNDQVHHNTQQQQLFQVEYMKNGLENRQKLQIKRQIQRLQQQQKINILMQQNVSKQESIQDMLRKLDCTPQKVMEVYGNIHILQQQHQKLYEGLFQQIINQQELLQSQFHTERLQELHEKEIKLFKEEEKATYQKNLEEHSSVNTKKLKTMEDRESDDTIEEISSLTEIEEQITELKTMTEKCIEEDRTENQVDKDELSIKWTASNFKFQLKRQKSNEKWERENLIPLLFPGDSKNDLNSADYSIMSLEFSSEQETMIKDAKNIVSSCKNSLNSHVFPCYNQTISKSRVNSDTNCINDPDLECLQSLAKENIQRHKVHEVLRQVLNTVQERLEIGFRFQKLQQEKTKALIYKNMEQQQHLQENLLHTTLTTDQKYVVRNKILHLYILLQQLLQQQQFEEKQIDRIKRNQDMLKLLINKNVQHMENLLYSLKKQQLQILNHINNKGSELKKLILSHCLNSSQEKQARNTIFKLHQLHSKIVIQLHTQETLFSLPTTLASSIPNKLKNETEKEVPNNAPIEKTKQMTQAVQISKKELVKPKTKTKKVNYKRTKCYEEEHTTDIKFSMGEFSNLTKYNVETKPQKGVFDFEGLSKLTEYLDDNVEKNEHLAEIQRKLAIITKEQENILPKHKTKVKYERQISQYCLQPKKMNSEELDKAIANLHKLQTTIESLKEQTLSQLK